jgi:hypothetical protein
MKKIDRFLQLFSEFNLIVTEPGRETGKVKYELEGEAVISPVIHDLQKSIRKLEREYTAAKKAYKAGRIPREELFDYEWRLFELKEELRKIQGEE